MMRKRKNKDGFTPTPICRVVEHLFSGRCSRWPNPPPQVAGAKQFIDLAKCKLVRGFSLVELMMAFAIIVIIFAAIVPQFRAIRNSWTGNEAKAEIIQNGRVLVEHITRSLAAAKQIVSVTLSSNPNGSITFRDNNDINDVYKLSGGYVVFGVEGSEAQLAGPVDRFQISCYSLNDLNNPTADVNATDVNAIRLVRVETDFPNDDTMGTDKTFTTSVYLRTNANTGGGLVGYWKLDETSGLTAADSSGSGNNGTLKNMDSDDWTGGVKGGALELDGINDYVDCGNAASLDLANAVTLAAWVKTNDAGNNQYNSFVGKGDTSYAIQHQSSNQIEFFIYDTSAWYNTWYPINTSFNGVWHHLAGTYDGSILKLYIDGTVQDTKAHIGSIKSTAYKVYIGENSQETGSYYNGVIDDVRIYNRALTPAEIAQLANVLRYRDCNEAFAASDTNSLTISTPNDTNVGDLLIAAVATDGSTTISPPLGWTTEINQGSNGSEVTLGAWWKLAVASEPASHTFTWTGSEQAYGWMMRFTGHNSTNPIDACSTANQTSSTPTSPAVTTTVSNCIILRLGAFDDNDIEVNSPGLSDPCHTAITMDKSGGGSTSPPTFQAAGSAVYSTSTITPAWPAHLSGDVALLFVESCGGQAATLSTPAGFANVTNSPQATGVDVNGTQITVFWCRATSSSMSSPVVADPGNHVYGIILTFRNVISTGDPWDVTAGGIKATTSLTTTFEAVTTSVDNTLIVLATSRSNDLSAAAWSSWTNANLSSLLERSDGGTTQGNGGGIGVATGIKSTAGDTGQTTAAVTPTTVDGHITIALKPPATVTGTVSGGAGYVRQSTAGLSSGTPTFSLTASNEARMLTIAIAPADANYTDCCGDIRP